MSAGIVDLEEKDQFGFAPIHIAAIENKPKIIEIFLNYRKGEDNNHDFYINLQDNSEKSPLIMAIEFDKKDAIECLILNGASVSFKNSKFDKTPFDVAHEIDEKNGNKKMERFLNQKVAERMQGESN